MENRTRGQLLSKNVDINPEKLVDPTIKYVAKPEINSCQIMLEKRKTDNLNDQ